MRQQGFLANKLASLCHFNLETWISFAGFSFQPSEFAKIALIIYIARELTRSMGGELELIRTGAEGTTFRITLPAA